MPKIQLQEFKYFQRDLRWYPREPWPLMGVRPQRFEIWKIERDGTKIFKDHRRDFYLSFP